MSRRRSARKSSFESALVSSRLTGVPEARQTALFDCTGGGDGGSPGTLLYVVATPRIGEKYTEFYILASKERRRAIRNNLRSDRRESDSRRRGQGTGADRLPVEVTINGARPPSRSFQPGRRGQMGTAGCFHASRCRPGTRSTVPAFQGWDSEPYREAHLWIDVK